MNSKAAFALIPIIKQLVDMSTFSSDSLCNCLTDLDNNDYWLLIIVTIACLSTEIKVSDDKWNGSKQKKPKKWMNLWKKSKLGKFIYHLTVEENSNLFGMFWAAMALREILFLQWESENLSTSLRPFGQADHGFAASDFQPQYPTLDYTDKPAWECQRRVLFSLIYDFSVGDLNSNIIFAFFLSCFHFICCLIFQSL